MQIKSAKDLKVYQNWIYVRLNAKRTEKNFCSIKPTSGKHKVTSSFLTDMQQVGKGEPLVVGGKGAESSKVKAERIE